MLYIFVLDILYDANSDIHLLILVADNIAELRSEVWVIIYEEKVLVFPLSNIVTFRENHAELRN